MLTNKSAVLHFISPVRTQADVMINQPTLGFEHVAKRACLNFKESTQARAGCPILVGPMSVGFGKTKTKERNIV
jgi:hypothetical protein